MTVVVLAGAAFGLGVWGLITAIFPKHDDILVALSRLGQPEPAQTETGGTLDDRIGRWLMGRQTVVALLKPLAADLRLLDRTPAQQATELVTHAFIGFAFAPVVAIGAATLGINVPFLIPIWLAVAGAAIATFIRYRNVREQAIQARAAFGHALSAYCDVAGMAMAAGHEVYAALFEAAAAGEGPAFAEVRNALQVGFVAGDKPWQALRALGEDIGVDDLLELAATVALAEDEGAAVRDTIASRARSIRERLIADTEKKASSATERMAVPGAMLMIGFLWFLTYPALSLLLQQTH